MAVPVLKLNLAPPPTLWRRHHGVLGWSSLVLGSLALVAVAAISFLAHRETTRAGKEVLLSAAEAKSLVRKQLAIQDRLRSVDVEKELPVWRLAERILGERSLPWSRLTAELERSLVQDVRLKSIQRTRDASQSVELKLRGEARSRIAEEAFVAALQQNPCFTQVILEREADRPGGGVEFDYTLPVSPEPPPFIPLPKYGPLHPVSAPPLQAKPAVQVPSLTPPAPTSPVGTSAPQPTLRPPTRLNPLRPSGLSQPPSGHSREERP